CLDQMADFYEIMVSKKGLTVERIREHQNVLRVCRKAGIEAAFAKRHGKKEQPLEVLIRTFFLADGLDDARALAEQYPELLDSEVEERIDEVVGFSFTAAGTQQTEDRRQLLRRCRKVGI